MGVGPGAQRGEQADGTREESHKRFDLSKRPWIGTLQQEVPRRGSVQRPASADPEEPHDERGDSLYALTGSPALLPSSAGAWATFASRLVSHLVELRWERFGGC